MAMQGTTQIYAGLCSVEIVNTALISGSTNILPATTALTIAGGGTLDVCGNAQQVASLSDSGAGRGGSIVNSSASPVVLTISPSGGSTTFSGSIQGGGGLGAISLVVNGNGMQVLAGSNNYTGPTGVNQGGFIVNGSLVSPLTVNSGGTLGGTGILASVTITPGGNLSPGDALGVLTVSGSLILQTGAVLDYGLDTPLTSDMISCGTLVLSDQQFSDFNFVPTANFGLGTCDLITFGSSSGSLGAITSGTIDGLPASLAILNNDLVLNVVPEPSIVALLAAGAVGLAGYGSRRRRAAGRTAQAELRRDAPVTLSFPSHVPPASAACRAA